MPPPAHGPAHGGPHAGNGSVVDVGRSTPCWNTGKCKLPSDQCYVHYKTAAAGLALCRSSCPANWLCETRVPDGTGAMCGPAPLPEAKALVSPTDEMRALLASSPWGDAVTLCNRANPPAGPHSTFEITCYDGGQTGNRYVMVQNLLMRAACCGGVALLPPEFDHFPQSGASCIDFRGLRSLSARPGFEGGPLPLTPPGAKMCSANASTSSKRWWTTLAHETSAHCKPDARLNEMVKLTASLYVGFGVRGKVFRDTRCERPAARTLMMHLRSGDIFSNWKDGKHLTTHGGFQHDPMARGQPPLSFYQGALAHRLGGGGAAAADDESGEAGARIGGHPYAAALLATSPDRSNPVVGAVLPRVNGSDWSEALSVKLTLSSSSSFEQDLSQLLCAEHLAAARSSLNSMLFDSPNLHNIYQFDGRPGQCGPPIPCVNRSSSHRRLGGRGRTPFEAWRASQPRMWCVAAKGGGSVGAYSVMTVWNHSAVQVEEMLNYGVGTIEMPVLMSGPPLPCPA